MDKTVRAIVGDIIRKRRAELGYSQEGFAFLAGLARTYYGRVERGQQNISLERLIYVAAYLETSIPELTEGLTSTVCHDFVFGRGRG